MSQYIVSARKYRPTSFDALVGQDNIARTLKNSILRGQLSHAYLFCGPRGVGKTSAARIFAKTINCQNPGPDMEPCGECESCLSFAEGRSYCIHELDAASNNGVDDMKALIDQVRIPPQVGKYSVFIIDEVHMLSTSAFNAFLKTLEEPPAHAIFILATTEKHKILATILSRCQTYDFNRIGIEDMVRNLRNIADDQGVKIDDESLHVIARKADGAMRDALTIFDQTVAFCGQDIVYADVVRNLNVLDYEYGFRLVDAFLSKDYAAALLLFDEVLSKGFNDLHFISSIGSHLRDLLVSRTGGMESLLDFPESLRVRYREQAARCSVKFLFDALGVISQCESGYRGATNQRLHIEFSLMKLSFLSGVPETETLPATKSASAAPAASSAASSPAPASVSSSPAPAPVSSPATDAPAASPVASAASSSGPASVSSSPAPAPVSSPATDAPAAGPVASAASSPAPVASPAASPDAPAAADRKTASRLSLSSILEGTDGHATDDVREDVESGSGSSLPDIELIEQKWKELSSQYSSQPRLSYALSSASLSIRPGEGFETVVFQVTNESQKKWIEERILRDLEGRFQKLLSSSRVRLEPVVAPEEKQDVRVYMPSEKAAVMMAGNEDVRNLVVDLGLDVK